MATLKPSESRRLYSWWWDSHIIPTNSKWLQGNLKDMDANVKAMIKLVEEDADTFKSKIELYYRKRPEFMKLIEEFYRAYRALAERYDHVTRVLDEAERTMAEAFPDHVPFMLPDDSPAGSSTTEAEPHTPEIPLYEPDDVQEKILPNDVFHLSAENQSLKTQITSESKRASKAEMEVQKLKEALAKLESEKAGLLHYQQSLEKISHLETEVSSAQASVTGLHERASKAETEVQTLKEMLSNLEAEREAGLLQYHQCLEMISNLEAKITNAEESAKNLDERACKAETEAENLKEALSRLENGKDAALLKYKECLETICNLEIKIASAEEEAKNLNERAERAETEVQTLKQALVKLEEQKEAAALQYQQCLERISIPESEVSHAQEARRLNTLIETGVAKLPSSEEHCLLLESINQSLWSELEALVQKMGMQTQELREKHEELQRFYTCIQEDGLHFLQADAALRAVQSLHFQPQEGQRNLDVDQIEKLRTGIIEILSSLEVETDYGSHDKIREDQMLLKSILRKIEDENCSFLKAQDEKQQLSFQNFVLITLLEQMKLQTALLERGRNTLEKEFKHQMEELLMLQNEKHKLLEMNLQLETQIKMGEHREEILKSEMEKLQAKFSEMQESYLVSQNENSKLFEEKGVLQKELSDMKEVAHMLDEESVLSKAFALKNLLILEGCITEKSVKLKGFSKDLDCLCGVNSDLPNVIRIILEKLEIVEGEKLHLKKSAEKLENEMSGVRNANEQLNHQIITGNDLLYQKEMELLDAEQKHRVAESENKMLCRDVEDLKKELNESEVLKQELEKDNLELLADKSRLIMEIGCIHEANRKFESESASKTEEIEQLNGTLHILEGKNEGLKSELAAYLPGIVSLRDSISFLKDHALLQTKMELLLQEVEKAIMQLSDANSKLTNSAEEKEETRKARRVFEKIERLQVQMQKIQSKLLKPTEYRSKGQTEVQERKVMLRDYLNGFKRSSPRRKKIPFCACVRTKSSRME